MTPLTRSRLLSSRKFWDGPAQQCELDVVRQTSRFMLGTPPFSIYPFSASGRSYGRERARAHDATFSKAGGKRPLRRSIPCILLRFLFGCAPSFASPLDELRALRDLALSKGVSSLPGCPMQLEKFVPICRRAMSRGYVQDRHGEYVLNGFIHGFDLGVVRESLRGRRVFRNYPTAVAARASVSKAVRSRLNRNKSIRLGLWADVSNLLGDLFGADYFVFPMGAVPKPHAPTVMRPTSDHTRTGLNMATVLGILGHSLDAYKQLEHLLSAGAWMTVADVDDAFSYIPLAPWLWAFMLFRWFVVNRDDDEDDPSADLHCYVNLFADFGTRGAPGTFKLILVDVFIGMARSEFVLTIPIVVYVDDVALVSGSQEQGDQEMHDLQVWTSNLTGLGWQVLKGLCAAQVNLYIGFWWNTPSLTRTLPEKKLAAYLSVLLDASKSPSLTLHDYQSLAGKMQRGLMTLPPGAACLLVNCYILMSGLTLPWQRRRTTRAARQDFLFVHDLLRFNQGRGYYSYDGFPTGPGFCSDASKSRDYTGGGWVTTDGYYDHYKYGSSASRKPIDYLEGDSVLRCETDNAHRWTGLMIPAGIDNKSFELSAEAGRSRADRLNDLLRGSFVLQLQYNFILAPYWLASAENYLADALSRRNGLEAFLSRAYEFVEAGCILRAHHEAGRTVTLADNDYLDAMQALRQLLKGYSSNYGGDGPVRGAGVGGDAQLLSIQYPYTSIFEGLPPELADRMDEVLDNRLRPNSLRKVTAGFSRWCSFADERGWPRIIETGHASRGGRLGAWIISMIDNTALVYASISTYVWGMRTMHTLQHKSDPAMGCEFFRELMRSASVLTAVPGEPRKRVELDVLRSILLDIYTNHWGNWVMVQLGLIINILLFTFSRTECPCPKNFTGPDSFDINKHWQVRDMSLRRSGDGWVLWVRFKAIKQDARIERPEARHADPNLPPDMAAGDKTDSKDWVPIGDVPDDPLFSISNWYMQFTRLLGRQRAPEEPFFLAEDGCRPYTYSAFAGEFKRSCIAHGGTDRDAPHGIRVLGYFLSKSGNGLDLTVAHGGWSADSDGHSRYDRFEHTAVLGVPAGMLGVASIFANTRAPRTGASRGGTSTSAATPAAPAAPAAGNDASSDDDGGDSSGLPPESTRVDRVTANGRKYSVYLLGGRQYASQAACWRAFALQGDDLASEGDVPPSPEVEEQQLVVPPPAPLRRSRVPGRSAFCNHPNPDDLEVLCSRPVSHDGNCDWWLGGRRR